MELRFPIEFIVEGAAVSFQAKRAESRNNWKARVKAASTAALPDEHQASANGIAVTLFYFPNEPMQGDVDNIVKLVLDALCGHIYVDDSQVERVVVQKFEPGKVFGFASPSTTLDDALSRQRPLLFIRLSDDPFEELI